VVRGVDVVGVTAGASAPGQRVLAVSTPSHRAAVWSAEVTDERVFPAPPTLRPSSKALQALVEGGSLQESGRAARSTRDRTWGGAEALR
jgi:hypothetical protein